MLTDWHGVLRSADLGSDAGRLDAANALLPGRINLSQLTPELASALTAAADAARAGQPTDPAFRDQAPWSAGLWAQLEAMMARSQARNEPILDFDPVIGAQDHQLANLNVATEAISENSHAVVRASFRPLR